jgi:glutamate-ammonia-ligase adenylyltransferase
LVSNYACRHIDILKQLLAEDDCLAPIPSSKYLTLLEEQTSQSGPYFGRELRRFRHKHLLRLLLRELAGIAKTEDSMASWSDCADALILHTLSYCQKELSGRYGAPCNELGEPAQLYVLAMGKLGGQELNYSSDIDLIMAMSASGYTNGSESISTTQYFTKVVQSFIQLFQNVTEDGFVFRVDLRLRPNGDSGALVSSLAAMETYYQEQGRDWERYAMVKARVVGEPSPSLQHWFHRLITPFTYRRYVDFSVIDSLRSMKSMIEREIQHNPRLDDVKRGLGGIREVEFIIQNIQLIRGGRLPALRQQNALKALAVIKQEKLLPRTAALREGYLFLRKLENCLQSENDQQTHSLPTDPEKQAQIAFAMGFDSWESLMDRLLQFRRIISNLFHAVLGKSAEIEDSDRMLLNQLSSVWQGHVETSMAINLLTSLGYQDPERCYHLIHAFRHAPRCRRLNQTVRLRLDHFMVLLLNQLAHVPNTESILLQVIRLLENIVGRSAYLALLTENVSALHELIYWFAESPFIANLLVTHPFLLEQLLEQNARWQPLSRPLLEQQLTQQLTHCHDVEAQENVLRQFKLTNWLLVARAEMRGYVDAVRAARFLSDLAEVIVAKVVVLAAFQLSERYPGIHSVAAQFSVIAYGKLGSREMNYDSDLDLVFVHSCDMDSEGLVMRLTQKIVTMLTTRSQSGVLYQVDTRLRPSGSAGLLVTTLAAFVTYQKTQAWTWEHQALIRSRILVGPSRVRRVFRELKQALLALARPKSNVLEDVMAMRTKIRQQTPNDEVKFAPGGLLDLEFWVQYLVLVNALPTISRYTHTLSLLQQLHRQAILTTEEFQSLQQAYRHYHVVLHQNLLNPARLMSWDAELVRVLSIVKLTDNTP